MNNDLTIKDAVDLSLDMGNFPDVIPVDYGLDLVLKTKPEYIVEANQPRKIRIDITSYRGISCNAIHYYAQINADGVKIIEKCEDGNLIHGGYICEEYSQICKNNRGKYEPYYRIDVMRKLTEEEIDNDPIRWEVINPIIQTHFIPKKKRLNKPLKSQN